MHTTTIQATAPATGRVPSSLMSAWHTTDHAAIGAAVYLDVVVTYGGHSVSGRDARTGTVRWSYTRTHRRVCSASMQEGTVLAVYAHDGICDEGTGLDAATGQWQWTRTLFGAGLNLRTEAGQGYHLMIRPGVVNLIHGGQGYSGLDSWDYPQPAGCTTRSAVLGSSGVLIASTCSRGNTLTLYPLQNSTAPSDARKRAFTVALGRRTPLSAAGLLVVLGADGRSVQVLDAHKANPPPPFASRTARGRRQYRRPYRCPGPQRS